MRSPILLTLAIFAATATLGCREDAESPTSPVLQPTVATTALSFQQVAVGYGQATPRFAESCGVTTDNLAYCWKGITGTVVAVPGARHFRSLSVGSGHTCGITTGDVLFCWGQNTTGQLGDGTTTDRLRPTRVLSGLRFREVSAGQGHTCAVSLWDIVYCWGWNGWGQIGDGTRSDTRLVPTKVAGLRRYNSVSAGSAHSCAVTTGNAAYCWGSNLSGELGIGTEYTVRKRPVAVVGGLSFRQIVAAWHTCGVTTDNKAYCWGKNGWELGSVAAGDDANQTTPRLVSGGLAFRAVDAHARHTCGVTTGAEAYCWGVEFQEGFPGSATPVEVPGGLQFRQVAAGTQIACGVTTDNRASCWGGDMRTPYLIR